MTVQRLEPVTIILERRCRFKARPCGLCGKAMSNADHKGPAPECPGQKRRGCERCGQPKGHGDHLGAPPSFNAMAGRDPNAYRSELEKYKTAIALALEASDLPRGLGRVHVEAEVSFGDATERDQGNFRVLPEKALGDVLENGSEGAGLEGRWLPNDSWDHYTFGNLERRETPGGVNRLVLTLFPAWPKPEDIRADTIPDKAGETSAVAGDSGDTPADTYPVTSDGVFTLPV